LQVKSKYSEKTCPSTTLSTTNPTSNPCRRSGKRATNRLSYGVSLLIVALHYDHGLSNGKPLRFLVERYEVWILATQQAVLTTIFPSFHQLPHGKWR
jgi:hypothetical protein